MRKRRNNRIDGFSLLEVVVGIALLGLVTVPICASLILSVRLNAHSHALMNARLQAASAVETLLAEGIHAPGENGWEREGESDPWVKEDEALGVKMMAEEVKDDGVVKYYAVSVTAEAGGAGNRESVTITTSVRKGGG